MKKEFRWAALQPLTGGMYLGTADAVGCDAQFILSYEGLNKISVDKKTGEEKGCGNEALIQRYLTQHDRMPNYYNFVGRGMKDANMDVFNVEINKIFSHNEKSFDEDKQNLDLVIAVPVCAGLSTMSTGSVEVRSNCNNNMKFISKYVLNVLKPTAYVFENAPALFQGAGPLAVETRKVLEEVAAEAGYSVSYIFTDSLLHNNCQQRKRTFVVFVKLKNGAPIKWELQKESITLSLLDVLNSIPKDATWQEGEAKISPIDRTCIDYAKAFYGDDWREKADKVLLLDKEFTKNDFKDFLAFVDKQNYDELTRTKIHNLCEHILYKASINKGAYLTCPTICKKDKIGAVMAKTNNAAIHPTEERHFNLRELMTLMGLPFDFDIISKTNMNLIGQNVPVKTANWVVRNVKSIIDNYDTLETDNEFVKRFNNTK